MYKQAIILLIIFIILISIFDISFGKTEFCYKNNLEIEDLMSEINSINDKILCADKLIGEMNVNYWEHFIDDVYIKNDSILLHSDPENKNILKYEKKWTEIDIEDFVFSEIEVDNFIWKKKVIFPEETDCQNFYYFNEPIEYPVGCWEVRHTDGTTILYDSDENMIGNGIPAPSESFLMTGPHKKKDVWKYLRSNAETFYSQWSESVISVFNPHPSTSISARVSNPNVELFYEVAHGSRSSFQAHVTEGGTIRKYYSTPSGNRANVRDDMADRNPITFAFIGSCGGMDKTDKGTFSYEFRKGQMINTVTIGYTGMGGCSGWSKAKQWQNYMFTKMDQKYTIKESFDLACAEYPSISNCVKFVGDENLIIRSGNRPPYTPNSPKPNDNKINIPSNLLLSWVGRDPDREDTVYYDVYMEADSPNPSNIVSYNQTNQTYNANSLNDDTDYYWKIVARDNHSEETEGPVWHFKTVVAAGDNADQQQFQSDYFFRFSSGSEETSTSREGKTFVQSFKPGETSLSSVKLFLKKEGNPGSITVEIKNNLEESELVSISKPSRSISSNLEWVEFDLQDIDVNTGQTYYIVVTAEGIDKNNNYLLSTGLETEYNDGFLYILFTRMNEELWREFENHDLTFRTYLSNDPPFPPINPKPIDNELSVNLTTLLSVTVSDPDDDNMSVTFFDASDDSVIGVDNNVASGSSALVYWNDLDYGTTYSWYAITDDGVFQTYSDVFSFTVNSPPVFSNMYPENGSTDVLFGLDEITVDVTDVDGDSFIWSITTSPTIGFDNGDSFSDGVKVCHIEGLMPDTLYTWTVSATDERGASNQAVYSFKTKKNNPPEKPVAVSPADNAEDVSIICFLNWSCFDPDPGDILTYDVFFGKTNNPELVEEKTMDSSYVVPYDLDLDTTYYWKIKATDSFGKSTESDIWSFTTSEIPPPPAVGSIELNFPKRLCWAGVKADITNNGVRDASNIFWHVSVNGGLFDRINISKNGCIDRLNCSETERISTYEFLDFKRSPFGIGKAEITVIATDKNDVIVGMNSVDVIIIFRWMFVL